MVAMRTAAYATGLILALSLLQFDARADDRINEASRRSVSSADLATIVDLDGLSVSPDGAWAAFSERRAVPEENRYDIYWSIAPIGAVGDARRIAVGDTPILPAYGGQIPNGNVRPPPPIWSLDSTWIIYLRKDNDSVQVWRSRTDGALTEQLTHNESSVANVVLSEDGRRLLFQTELRPEQRSALLRSEARRGFLFDDRFQPDSDATAQPVRLTAEQEAAARETWVYDIDRAAERRAMAPEHAEFTALTAPIIPSQRPAFRALAARSPNGALAWTEARDPARQGWAPPVTLVAQTSPGVEPEVCPAPICTGSDIRGLWWRNQREVIFALTEPQETSIYSWRLDSLEPPRLVLRTAGRIIHAPYRDYCSIARDHLICFYEQVDAPRRLISIELASGRLQTIYDPNPAFRRLDLGNPPQRIDIRTSSGAATFGYLVLPPWFAGSRRLPLVIVTYRCAGFLRGGTGDEYPIFPYAAEGFAVLCLDIPTEDTQRRATQDVQTYGNWARGPGDPIKHQIQSALDAAVIQLDAMGIVDLDRIGVTGLSYGAETVHFALFNMPRLTAAIASGAGIEPSATFLVRPQGHSILEAWGLSSPSSSRWDNLSVSRNVAQVNLPLLINISDRELLNVLETYAALRYNQRAVEMFVFPDEYHVKWQPAHRLAVYNRNIDWMNFWLRGVESGLTGDPAQYVRWRAMREQQCRLFGPEGTARSARPREHEDLTDDELVPWYCRPDAHGETTH